MISHEDVFQISSKKEFEKITLKVFRQQYDNNLVYQQFCNFLNKDKTNVKSVTEIPFLPIQFFKSHTVVSSTEPVQQTFTSSGTTNLLTHEGGTSNEPIRSKHLVTDVSWYEESYRLGFSEFYGNIEDYCVLALLPSYLERDGSSLIYMVNDLIESSNHSDSGFYLNNYSDFGSFGFPAIDAGFEFSDKLSVYASAGKSFRVPSYTDLYYKGRNNIGNPTLTPEQALTYEGGFKYKQNNSNFQLGVFNRNASELIDWVKQNPADPWQPQNFYEVNVFGVEAQAQTKNKSVCFMR